MTYSPPDPTPGAAPRDEARNPLQMLRELAEEAWAAGYDGFSTRLEAIATRLAAVPRADREAYEQAAKWCEERAAKIRARAQERPDAYDRHGEMLADWIQGDADTIRFNAGIAAARAPGRAE